MANLVLKKNNLIYKDSNLAFKQKPLWSPAYISTEGWWDASDTTTCNCSGVGTFISQLDDKSGNDQHLTQPTEWARPQTTVDTQNGLHWLYYTGGNALATYGNNFAVPADGNFSVFQVGEIFLPLDNEADGMFSMLNASGRDWQFVGGVDKNNWNGRLVVTELGGSNMNFATPMGIGASIYNIVFDYDSSAITGYVDGNIRPGTTYTLKVTTPQTFIVMSNRVGNAPAGHVGETIIVNDVTEVTRQKIEGYLAWKWDLVHALPVDHPYKDAPPYV